MSYNPYDPSPWLTYILEIPKEKPNVGYWPRGRSSSSPARWEDLALRNAMRPVFSLREPDLALFAAEEEVERRYHAQQQQMTDDFRAKFYFANRIQMP